MKKNIFFSLLTMLLLSGTPALAETGTTESNPANAGDGGNTNSSMLIAGRYKDNGDGTVTDVTTKLMWMRCVVGQEWDGNTCSGNTYKVFQWESANRQRANFAGYRDWRIPTIDELRSLVYCRYDKSDYYHDKEYFLGEELCCSRSKDLYTPTLIQDAFLNTPREAFWSSSKNDKSAWKFSNDMLYLDFRSGCARGNSRMVSFAVRLVRDEK